jgi:CheY-like chemotaxis protein
MCPLNVLIVDDDPLICSMIHAMLGQDRHQVEVCSSAPDALKRFRAGDIDMVITEYWLPGMSGGELALTIKNQLLPRPVILMAGHLPIYDPPGVDWVLLKPFSLLELRQAIHEVTEAEHELA